MNPASEFNPVLDLLVSCSNVDFGFWSPKENGVEKYGVSSKILCASWTSDGQTLALGMLSGIISIRDLSGKELRNMSHSASVWALMWSSSSGSAKQLERPKELLAVGCWDKTLSFYDRVGKQYGEVQNINFYPTSVQFFGASNEYILIGGTNKSVGLYTCQGRRLCSLAQSDAWIWTVICDSHDKCIIFGDQNGSVSVLTLDVEKVQSIYKSTYACRCTNLTDILIQDLAKDQKVKIECKDDIQMVAVFRDIVALLLSDCAVYVYESSRPSETFGLSYELKHKVRDVECDVLAVASKHIFTSCKKTLKQCDFNGRIMRKWELEMPVCVLRVYGGCSGSECIIAGMCNGEIKKVFPTDVQPKHLLTHSHSVRSINFSIRRQYVALIDDENQQLFIYDSKTKKTLFKHDQVDSAVFNGQLDEILCFSSQGRVLMNCNLIISLEIDGIEGVVGFIGSKVYFLQDGLVTSAMVISFSDSVKKLTDAKKFSQAYKVACLGVSERDWKTLALAAMAEFELTIAQRSFGNARDLTFAHLIDNFNQQMKQCVGDLELDQLKGVFNAEIAAIRGDFRGAANLFAKNGEIDRAVELMIDLKKWEDAKSYASQSKTFKMEDVALRHARWAAEEAKDWHLASDLYMSCGCFSEAVKIVTENKADGWINQLINLARNIPKSDGDVLRICATCFVEEKEYDCAKDVFLKLNDLSELMKLYMQLNDWDAAASLMQQRGRALDKGILLPYAEGLLLQDRFGEALEVYSKGGLVEYSRRMLKQLADNAIMECRFKDASYFFWLLTKEQLKMQNEEGARNFQDYKDTLLRAKIYYAYQRIFDYCTEPFTSLQSEVLFQTAYFICLCIISTPEVHVGGVSIVSVLYTLAKQAKNNGAFKLARAVYTHLQEFKLPRKWREIIEVDSLKIQGKPTEDNEELLHVCYRCGASNYLYSLFSQRNVVCDTCSSCGHPFIRCFINFDVLPLVEFTPDASISEDKAIKLIHEMPPVEPDNSDTFDAVVTEALDNQIDAESYSPVTLGTGALRSLRRDEVYYCPGLVSGMKAQFYKNMIPDIAVALSPGCHLFYHEEEFEFA
eukprot:CAMPEP_0116008550 /NCGR_PEP_ID=MMETSP0321-20121206/2921_1 /TAXON_ID=163516 /ORGANISM="Leptocylindrus danicus var. danicus, Strain B650" /LENGTH=1074 /DNA_ID=CAMNT_0003477377 /DNA_START=331 /DNA_END=3552 /DNA_ORIENTATION=+